jgi:hypothetical protein
MLVIGVMTLDISEQYILPVARPDWDELLAEWQAIIPPGSSPWLLTKFGESIFCHDDGRIGILQVSGFQYQVVAKDKTDFLEWLADPDKIAEWFLAPLVDRLESTGKHLGPEQCYSFIRPLALGGTFVIENVMVISIREHFKCWGDVFRQIKDMPDGDQVVLKVT